MPRLSEAAANRCRAAAQRTTRARLPQHVVGRERGSDITAAELTCLRAARACSCLACLFAQCVLDANPEARPTAEEARRELDPGAATASNFPRVPLAQPSAHRRRSMHWWREESAVDRQHMARDHGRRGARQIQDRIGHLDRPRESRKRRPPGKGSLCAQSARSPVRERLRPGHSLESISRC